MITATDCCLPSVDLCRRVRGLNIIPACWGRSTEQGVRQRAKARLRGEKSQPSLKWIMPLYRITACLTSCISVKERRFSLYKHVFFSQCCSFLQSHPVISEPIIPTDKVKKPIEYQLLKMWFIVVFPWTGYKKTWRICFKTKKQRAYKTHYKHPSSSWCDPVWSCAPWPGAETATRSRAWAKRLLNEGGVFRRQSYCWLGSAPRSRGLWSDTQHTWHLHACTLCHVS